MLGQLGPYELLCEIGHGAQGTVYKARQPGTRREVVIKRLAAGAFATPAMRARFEREIEVLGTLRHPNIVTVHAAERIDGQPLVVMEWVEGVPIDRWAASGGAAMSDQDGDPAAAAAPQAGGGPGVPQVLSVVALVCDAVAHAHQRSVAHRDLKPSNILVDRAGQPRVLDFGLAAPIDGPTSDGTATSAVTQGFVGTPAYAAPEQLSGDGRGGDTRADIFALGVILYELLTGVWPFAPPGTRLAQAGLAEVFDAIRTVEPRRPSALRNGLGSDLDAVVLKALARDPAARYQSADALAADLRRCLAGEPVLAQPLTTIVQLRSLVRRHRIAFGAGAAIAVLTLIFAVVSTTLAVRLAQRQQKLIAAEQREHQQRVAAEQAEARTAAEAVKVRATNAFLQELLSTNDPALKLRPDTRLRELLEEAGRSLAAGALAGEPDVEAAVRLSIGRTYIDLKMPRLGEPHLRRALELEQRPPGAETARLAAVCAQLALCLSEQREFDEGLALHRRALDLHRRLHPGDAAAGIPILWRFATALRDSGQVEPAEPLLREALQLAERTHGPRHAQVAEGRYRLGVVLLFARRLDEAEVELREALTLQRELLGPGHPACGDSLLRLGQTLVQQQQPEAGEALMRDACAVLAAALGEAHPNASRAQLNLARFLFEHGRHAEAEALFEEVARNREQYFGERGANLITHLSVWARYRLRRRDFAGAEALARESLRMCAADADVPAPVAREARLTLADVLAAQGCFAEAEAMMVDVYAEASVAARPSPTALRGIAERVVRLYAAWMRAEPDAGHETRLAEWRARASGE